ncbi:MAG: TPM domain-containing protein [Spirochaetes bacterium]|nr:TPM domain-containing protein [Spirochaetota bacterium]
MKKTACRFSLLLAISSLLLPAVAAARAIPAITRPVNDYASIISPAQEHALAGMIIAHRTKTGIQMAVLTVGTTGGMPLEEFSLKTAEKWGGGTRERDDGLLFTVALYDRRMRIEVGYGLEGYITDLKAGRILDGIRDDFRSYQYGRGIEKAIREMILATEEVRPGVEPPAAVRLWGAFARVVNYYSVFFIFGALMAVLLIIPAVRFKLNGWVIAGAAIVLSIGVPILLQYNLHGAWYWTPFAYITGFLAGAGIIAALMWPKTVKMKIIATVFTAIPALASLSSIVYLLEVMKPAMVGTTENETLLLAILIGTNLLQFFVMVGIATACAEGGGSYSGSGTTSSSWSSSSFSSSSGSNDTSWSGGGGSFGGGGASSSW